VRATGLSHAQHVWRTIRRGRAEARGQRLDEGVATHRAQVQPPESRVVCQLARRVGPARHLSHPLALDEVECFPRLEALLHDSGRPGNQGREQHHGEASDPEEGHWRVDAVFTGQPPTLRQESGMTNQRPMRVHHGFGHRSRAGGVDDGQVVSRSDLCFDPAHQRRPKRGRQGARPTGRLSPATLTQRKNGASSSCRSDELCPKSVSPASRRAVRRSLPNVALINSAWTSV
jgi:hypothetical protein